MRSFYDLMGVPASGFDPDHRFTTSWLLTPFVLASLRLLFGVYCFATIFVIWGFDGAGGEAYLIGQEFSYFTSITYWGVAFYLLVAGIHTFVYAATGSSWLSRWPRILQALHSLFYTTIVTFPFLVTIVYWAVIFLPPWFSETIDAWSNISRHALNSVFALFELIFANTNPPMMFHLVFLIIILLMYLAVAYITYYSQGFYVYFFLDPSTGRGRVAAYCVGIAAAIVVVFFIAWFAIWVRRRFTGPGKRSRKDIGRGALLERNSNEASEVSETAEKTV